MPFSNAGKMEKISGPGRTFGALLTDLSKAFNCFDYELLIGKLNTHEFCLESKDPRIQRSNPSKRNWLSILFGVPKGSILGASLYDLFLADLFFIVEKIDIASYAHDNTSYVRGSDLDEIICRVVCLSNVVECCLSGLQII